MLSASTLASEIDGIEAIRLKVGVSRERSNSNRVRPEKQGIDGG